MITQRIITLTNHKKAEKPTVCLFDGEQCCEMPTYAETLEAVKEKFMETDGRELTEEELKDIKGHFDREGVMLREDFSRGVIVCTIYGKVRFENSSYAGAIGQLQDFFFFNYNRAISTNALNRIREDYKEDYDAQCDG